MKSPQNSINKTRIIKKTEKSFIAEVTSNNSKKLIKAYNLQTLFDKHK